MLAVAAIGYNAASERATRFFCRKGSLEKTTARACSRRKARAKRNAPRFIFCRIGSKKAPFGAFFIACSQIFFTKDVDYRR